MKNLTDEVSSLAEEIYNVWHDNYIKEFLWFAFIENFDVHEFMEGSDPDD